MQALDLSAASSTWQVEIGGRNGATV